MPEIITSQEPLEHLLMGIFDSSEGQFRRTLTAERIVDISDICEETTIGVGQTVIKYGRAKAGLVAQIVDRFEYGQNPGTAIHLFPEELGIVGMVTADWFIQRAGRLGCDTMQLAEVIIEFSPEPGLAVDGL